MPTYNFINTINNEEFEEFMSISSLETFLQENPHIVQQVGGAPMIHSGRGLKKPDNAFREILREVKKKNSKGISRSTVNTF